MCYCSHVKAFVSNPEFVILLHPKETRKAINTGRMASLVLENARIIVGHDLSDDLQLNDLINDPSKRCFLLFPGPAATDLNAIAPLELEDSNTQTDVFLILDATWSMAKKMLTLSTNLQKLPLVMFQPPHPSRFLIREQPGLVCFSTIETIHHIIDQRGHHPDGEHHQLLSLFESMVQKQIGYEEKNRASLRLAKKD